MAKINEYLNVRTPMGTYQCLLYDTIDEAKSGASENNVLCVQVGNATRYVKLATSKEFSDTYCYRTTKVLGLQTGTGDNAIEQAVLLDSGANASDPFNGRSYTVLEELTADGNITVPASYFAAHSGFVLVCGGKGGDTSRTTGGGASCSRFDIPKNPTTDIAINATFTAGGGSGNKGNTASATTYYEYNYTQFDYHRCSCYRKAVYGYSTTVGTGGKNTKCTVTIANTTKTLNGYGGGGGGGVRASVGYYASCSYIYEILNQYCSLSNYRTAYGSDGVGGTDGKGRSASGTTGANAYKDDSDGFSWSGSHKVIVGVFND